MPMMVIDSPPFLHPLLSTRPTRSPTVLASVRESSSAQQQQQRQAPDPAKNVSQMLTSLVPFLHTHDIGGEDEWEQQASILSISPARALGRTNRNALNRTSLLRPR
jgi:hypothetical protein